jgi:ketosteroid isomerase-like protein
MATQGSTSTAARRLCDAITARDLEGIVGQFADDYVNETPAHPSRGFQGAAQVRSNWTRILAAVPDLRAEVVREAVVDGTEWSELSYTGKTVDGAPFAMVGVVILGVDDGLVRSARFYLEPVDGTRPPLPPGLTPDEAVAQHLGTS